MNDWKPGDVAVDGGGNRLMCAERADGSLVWMNTFGGLYPIDGLIEDARRLFVIDNEFDQTMVKHLRLASEDNSALTMLPWLADQIERQASPPKPDEPTGLGAVVEDADGFRWSRIRSRPVGSVCWQRDAASVIPLSFADIPVVRVLSEGVTP